MSEVKAARSIIIDPNNKPNLDSDWREKLTFLKSSKKDGDVWTEFLYSGGKEYKQYTRVDGKGNMFGLCTFPWGSRKDAKKTCKHLYASILMMEEIAERKRLDVVVEPMSLLDNPKLKKAKAVVVTKPEDIVVIEQKLHDIAADDEIRPVDKVRKFWPSKMDMTEKCPASYTADADLEMEIDKVHFAANIGRAVHSIAERVVRGEIDEITSHLAKSEAIKFGVEDHFEDVELLSSNAFSAWHGTDSWGGIKAYFINPTAETYGKFEHRVQNPYTKVMHDISISGYMDVSEVISAEEVEEATVKNWGLTLDWKSGRKGDDSSYRAQMLAYATLLCAKNPKLEQVTTMICWLRDKKFSMTTFSRDEIREWFKNFIRRSAFWNGTSYSPGDHCAWCKRYYECPARAKMINAAVTSLVGIQERDSMVINESGELVDPDKLYEAFKQAKSLEKLIATFLEDLKMETEKRGSIGVPSVGENRGFGYKTRRGNASFDSMKAWPILQDHFTDDELANIVNIGKGKLKSAADDKAPKGKKAELFRTIMNDLDVGGAVHIGKDVKTFGIMDLEEKNE